MNDAIFFGKLQAEFRRQKQKAKGAQGALFAFLYSIIKPGSRNGNCVRLAYFISLFLHFINTSLRCAVKKTPEE